MKKNFFLPVLLLLGAITPVVSQTYKTTADTIALNKEYLKVSNNITSLTTSLSKAQDELAKDTRKSDKATSDAQSTASTTADKASHATNGDVRDARRAKKEARRSVRDAKDSRRAGNNVEDQTKKVNQLSSDLTKNQNRLQELDAMRVKINKE
jgi:hypothetical protein